MKSDVYDDYWQEMNVSNQLISLASRESMRDDNSTHVGSSCFQSINFPSE